MRCAIIAFLSFLSFLLCGCASTKEIILVDSTGRPINRGYVFASQENILYPNSYRLFVTDENGTIRIPYYGLVRFYTGKEGFLISSFALVGEESVRVIIYSSADKIPQQCMTKFTEPPREITNIDRGSPEAEMWKKYVTTTPIIDVSQELIKNEKSKFEK